MSPDTLIQSLQYEIAGRKVIEVNDYVNTHIRYKEDPLHTECQSLQETFDFGEGNCEDFAIAKRDLLIKAGVDAKSLMLIVGEENYQKHMVLWWNGVILNNIINSTTGCDMCTLIPEYAIKHNGTIHTIDKDWKFTKTNKTVSNDISRII